MNIDDGRSRAASEPDRSRAKFGLGRVIVALALVWFAVSVFAFVADLVHHVFVMLVVAAVGLVIVKLAGVSRP
jgi:hypothetical protein